MRLRLLPTALIGALALTIGASAFAQQPVTKPQPSVAAAPNKQCCPFIPGYNELTADKKAYLDKTMKEAREKMHAEGSMLFAKMALLKAELAQPTVDKQKVNTLIKEINDLQTQILQNRVDTILKVKENTGINLPLMPPKGMFLMQQHLKQHGHPPHAMPGPGPDAF